MKGNPYKHPTLPPRSDPNYMKEWKKLNRPKLTQYNKEYREKHPEKFTTEVVRDIHQKYVQKNPDRHRKLQWQRNWRFRGIDILYEDFETILKNQNNRCAICQVELEKPNLDHNHKTKQIRGVLCQQCNHGIGLFRENIETIQSAINYLLFWKNSRPS